MSKQTGASDYIRNLLASRQLFITPRTMTLEDKGWIIFEHKDRELKIDPASGLWTRVKDDEWKCRAPRGAKLEWMENPIACTGRP